MRILMIAPTAFFSSRGGHVRILNEALSLGKRGHSVLICTFGVGRNIPSVKIVRSRLKSVPLNPGPSFRRLLFDVDLFFKSLEVTSRFRPHVIHAHLHEGALIGEILGTLFHIPVLLDAQGSAADEALSLGLLRFGSLLYRLVRSVEILITKNADSVITSSQQLATYYQKALRQSKTRITVVIDGVDVDHFRPMPKSPPLLKRLGIPKDSKVVVYLGSIERQQGILKLIEVAKLLVKERGDVHFLVMGSPLDLTLQECRERSAELGIASHIRFLGTIPYDEAPQYLALGDIAVSLKESRTESAGKVLSYMAMGLPVVCFDTLVNHEFLGSLGICCQSRSVQAICDRILYALNLVDSDAFFRATYVSAAKQFSWDSIVVKIDREYKRLQDKVR